MPYYESAKAEQRRAGRESLEVETIEYLRRRAAMPKPRRVLDAGRVS